MLEDPGLNLPDDVRKKLDVIQQSARKIQKVTARLKDISKLPKVQYVENEWMVNLSAGEEESDRDEDENN